MGERLRGFLNYGFATLKLPAKQWGNDKLVIPPLNLLNDYIEFILKRKRPCHLLVPEWEQAWRVSLEHSGCVTLVATVPRG
jgi:hypothetical protein